MLDVGLDLIADLARSCSLGIFASVFVQLAIGPLCALITLTQIGAVPAKRGRTGIFFGAATVGTGSSPRLREVNAVECSSLRNF